MVIVALQPDAERTLCEQFRTRTVGKEYLAVVLGRPGEPEGEIDAPIEEHPTDKLRMRIAARGGKASRTRYEVEEQFRGQTLLRCRPSSGRRHQIRVHLAHVGMPVVGDALYGGGEGLFLSTFKRGYRAKPDREEAPLIRRSALHAAAIQFADASGKTIRVEGPVPKDFERALKALRKWGG